MLQEERDILRLVKENLKVEVTTQDLPDRTEITVRLLLEDEEISSDTVNLYKE